MNPARCLLAVLAVATACPAALAQQDGNKTAAARQLGISRARLQRRLGHGKE